MKKKISWNIKRFITSKTVSHILYRQVLIDRMGCRDFAGYFYNAIPNKYIRAYMHTIHIVHHVYTSTYVNECQF